MKQDRIEGIKVQILKQGRDGIVIYSSRKLKIEEKERVLKSFCLSRKADKVLFQS
jgi:hypothetical protein